MLCCGKWMIYRNYFKLVTVCFLIKIFLNLKNRPFLVLVYEVVTLMEVSSWYYLVSTCLNVM